MQCAQATQRDLQWLWQDLTASLQIIHQTAAQRRPSALRLGDYRRLARRPLDQPIDDQPHQPGLQPRQVELGHLCMKAYVFGPLSGILTAQRHKPRSWCAWRSTEMRSKPGIGLVTNNRCTLQTTLRLHKRLQHFTATKFLVHTRVTLAN
jgi:hypothetical protein